MPRIARVETFVVCLVKITTDDGTHGWGEGYGPATVVRAGVEFLARLLLGGDALATGAHWQRLHLRTLDHGRRGVFLSAISALDLALWDLKGKLLGAPVHVLLGGRRRERQAVYATGLYFTRGPDLRGRLAREAASYAAQGFLAVKMKVGLGLDEDAGNAEAVRRALGPGVRLMMDANHAFSRAEARALAERVAHLDLGWFEEPVSPDDYAGYRELRRATRIPIAGGECEYGVHGFHQLFTADAVDIAQPDLGACGGLTEGLRIAALARAHSVDLTPHCWGTGIAFAAGLHFASTIDPLPGRLNLPEHFLEMDRSENPLRDQLTVPRFEPVEGRVAVPDAPGLGIEVDAARLEEFGVRG
jgi:D-galactarolactone cycloisomerase